MCRGVIKEKTVLSKCHITRDMHATRRRIIVAITFMLRTIPQKNTLNRLSSQFSALTRGKQNIADTSKNSKVVIVGRLTKRISPGHLPDSLDDGCLLMRYTDVATASPAEMRRNKRGNQKGASSLYDMAVFTLSNTILSMSTRT